VVILEVTAAAVATQASNLEDIPEDSHVQVAVTQGPKVVATQVHLVDTLEVDTLA
jgi:hypothetical protein